METTKGPLCLSYALSQTREISMGHWAVAPMRSSCWVAVSGWEWGGEGVGKRGRGEAVQHWHMKVTYDIVRFCRLEDMRAVWLRRFTCL